MSGSTAIRPRLFTVVVPILTLFLGQGTVVHRIERHWWLALIMAIAMGGGRNTYHAVRESHSPDDPKPLGVLPMLVVGFIGLAMYAFAALTLIHPVVGRDLYLPLELAGILGGTAFLSVAAGHTDWLW